ncbi:MAG: sulfatase-like hydrolase/transferase, partial [Immundisolibacteraceae bacterium]|nr:sulfatase-like hydrolase/transferase [Immundisolibacteraceae bacterium]
YNILFITSDQESFEYPTVAGFELPNRQRIAASGVSFQNHYTASSMCTASRGVIYTGRHEQQTGLFDNSNYPYAPDFPKGTPTWGNALQNLGYTVGYKGKWHLSKDSLKPGGRSFARALEPFGFNDWDPHGDRFGLPLEGYFDDDVIAAAAISWLRRQGTISNRAGKPWALTVSLVNPHDIQWVNVDLPGEQVQQNPNVARMLRPAPDTEGYRKVWNSPPARGLHQSLSEPDRPASHAEFVAAWDQLVGPIPNDREDMWQLHSDFYLNLLQDNDRTIGTVLDTLAELKMQHNTIIIFTSDHGEYGGAHGGMRNKGPGAYDEHIHVPLMIAHPEGPDNAQCAALSSHVDLFPTIHTLAGGNPDQLAELAGDLPGKDFSFLALTPSDELAALRPEGLLYNYDGLLTTDRNFVGKATANALTQEPDPDLKPNFNNRGLQRTFFDGRYKFTRYFAAANFNTPQTIEALLRDNDIELFDRKTDPDEMINLAHGNHFDPALIMEFNSKLNHLIAKEVGPDNGGAVTAAIENWGKWSDT